MGKIRFPKLFPKKHDEAQNSAKQSQNVNTKRPEEEQSSSATPPTPTDTYQLSDYYFRHGSGSKGWATTLQLFEGATTANIFAKYLIEINAGSPEYGKAFPILPWPNFGNWRVTKLNQKQDAALTTQEIVNAGLTNVIGGLELLNPAEVRTDDQWGLGSNGINTILEPAHVNSVYRGMIGSRQTDLKFRIPMGLAASTGMLLTSTHWQQATNLLTPVGCSELQGQAYPGGPDACDEHMNNTANGTDAVLQDYFGNDDSPLTADDNERREGLEGIFLATQESAQGQYRAAYGVQSYLLFKTLENQNGGPGIASALGAAPLIADLALHAREGDKISGFEIGQRVGIVGGSFLLNSLTTSPEVDVANGANFTYLLISPEFPEILERTFQYNNPLAPNQNTYDNADSVYNVIPYVSTASYVADSSWAGFNAGYSLTSAQGFQKFLPMILGTTGLGLQFANNAWQGDPNTYKYLGFGAGLYALGTGVGALSGKSKVMKKIMGLNPSVQVGEGGAGASVAVSF